MTASNETREVPHSASPSAGPGSDEVRELLRRVVDPEVGVNIVDLGLVYRIELTDDRLLIEMTMTSPACPMGDMIIDDAYKVLEGLSAACEPEIVLVWDPPWNPSMMSQRSKLALGWSAE